MNSQLKFFGISTSLFNFSYSIGKLFSVLYIYIFFGNSLVLAIGGLVLISLVHLFTTLLLGKLMGKIGVRTTLIISTIFFFLSFIPLYSIDKSNSYINYGLSLLLFGIARGMYFLPYHFFVLKLTEDKNRGSQYGKFLAICAFLSIFTPFIGGYTINAFGIQGIAVLSGLTFALSIIPLSKIENLKFNVTISLIKLLRLPNIKQSLNMNIFVNIQNQVYFWEIYVFLLLDKKYLDFGLLFALINAIGFVIAPLLGRFFDHKDKK
jgi:MFS family permease